MPGIMGYKTVVFCMMLLDCCCSQPALRNSHRVEAPSIQHAFGPSCASRNILCRVGRGPISDSTLGLTEALWIGPEIRGIYVGSPAIVKMADGPVVASHDFFGASTLDTTTQILIDRTGHGDGPLSRWEYAGNVSAMYWGTLFAHPSPARKQELYLLGVSGGDASFSRDIVISQSTDLGTSWTTPVTLFSASKKDGSYHCAPTPALVASNGRLYRAFETATEGRRHGLQAFIISTAAPVTNRTNLLDPQTWIKSSYVDPGPVEDASLFALGWNKSTKWSWEEGNAVESPSGQIFNLIRIDGQTSQNNTQNKAAVLQLSKDGRTLSFDRMINFPSCSSKFVIRRDPISKLYLTLSTDATPSAIAQNTVFARNHLVLAASADLYLWDTCYVVLMDDTGT